MRKNRSLVVGMTLIVGLIFGAAIAQVQLSNPIGSITNCTGTSPETCTVTIEGDFSPFGGGGAPPASAAYSFDQAGTGSSSFPITTGGPNELVFVFVVTGSAQSCSISDVGALTWTVVASKTNLSMCAWVAKAPAALSGDMVTITNAGSVFKFSAWAAFKGGNQIHDAGGGLPASSFGSAVAASSSASSGLIIGLSRPL
jgi:hypothetical protein